MTTIAIIGGRLKAGLSKEEIDYLGRTGAGIPKASRRDLPVLVAQGKDGACTVTTTMMIADMAGIRPTPPSWSCARARSPSSTSV